jgi:hypothetical protein
LFPLDGRFGVSDSTLDLVNMTDPAHDAIAKRLCTEWQKTLRRSASLDEMSAFLSGAKAVLRSLDIVPELDGRAQRSQPEDQGCAHN